jgi:hypothetical protein
MEFGVRVVIILGVAANNYDPDPEFTEFCKQKAPPERGFSWS